ncbi:MAG: fibrobacter succinogenes major paralogous domain-containing protein [Bacteroidales bacterium]|nr:fibrobacter succinogenes major paralogous domain-containing protein [Bacteroidales bacterium]
MKKIILLIAVFCVFCVGALHAQTPVKGLTVTGAYDTMKTVEPTPRFVSKTGELYKHPMVSVTGQVLTTPDRTSCTVTNAHTSTTDYTGSSTTPGTGGLETETESGSNIITQVTDQDGNVYPVVQIGSQCWMKENLRTTHYANGTSIALGSSTSTTTAYRYYPNNSSSNVSTYGYFYNWKAVMQNSSSSSVNPSGVQGICPTGWHVPSDAEWTQLTNYVGSQTQYQCDNSSYNIAKALASTTGWDSSSETCAVGNNPGTNNATGFSALPAGTYYGGFRDFGDGAYFWSATEINGSKAYSCYLGYNYDYVSGGDGSKSYGFSVRCIRD